MDVDNIFNSSAKSPNFYNITLEVQDIKELFDKILSIYKFGAVKLFSNTKSLDILSLSERRRLILKEYMMSIGIKPIINIYTPEQVHDIFKDIIYEFSLVKSRDKIVKASGVKSNKGLFSSVNLVIPKNIDILEQVIHLIDNNTAYKDILDVYAKKTELVDYKLKILLNNDVGNIKSGTIYVLRFDYC